MIRNVIAAILIGIFSPGFAHAASTTGDTVVTLSDKSVAFVFQLLNYDSTKDGDVFVAATDGAGARTIYRPVQDVIDGAQWKGYWGIKLAAGSVIKKTEVVIVKPAPPKPVVPAAISGKWTLADKPSGALTVKLEAEGDATKGYTLTGKVTVTDVGSFDATGTWNPATPDAPIKIEATNIYKTLLEGLLGQSYPKDAFLLGDKITATITLPAEWVTQLKKGVKTQDDLKAFTTGEFTASITIPFKLKFDPTKPSFDIVATVDPIGRTAAMALASGVTWAEPLGFLPVTFSTIDLTTDLKFERLTVKAQSDVDFFAKMPATLEMVTVKGVKPDLKITINPDVNIITGALGKLDVPPELTNIFTPLLKKIKFGTFTLSGLGDLGINGKLPSMVLNFSIELTNWRYDFKVDMPSFDFRKPELFTAKLGEIVLPVLKLNIDKIALDLGLTLISGKWPLVDLSADPFTLKLDAEGDPAKGITIDGSIGVKDLGDFKVNGLWGTANPSQVVFTADNAAKTIFEGTIGKAVPSGWFTMGDKITATVTLAKEWSDQLKKGSKGATASKSGTFTVLINVPFSLKFDPKKDAFKMTATIDPAAKTVKLALDAGQQWKEPFDFLPVTFDKIDGTYDFKLERLNLKANGDVDFFGKIPASIELVTLKGVNPDLKVTIKPDVNIVIGALGKLQIPPELTDIITPLLKKIEFGSFSLSGLGDLGIKGKLPSMKMDFTLNLPNFKYTFNIDMPDFDFRKPELFTKKIGEIVLPVLKLNVDKIAMGLALEIATGKWTLANIDLDLVKVQLDAEGDPQKGFTMDGSVTVKDGGKDAGTFKVSGLWGAADPSKVVFTADNPGKSILDATIGKVLPKDVLALKDKVYLTIGLTPEWQDQLKLGMKRATVPKSSSTTAFTMEIKIPFTFKLDPAKPAFAMEATIDPKAKTVTLALAPGQKWDKPFDILPVTFDNLSVTSDASFTNVAVKSSGQMDFIVKSPVDINVALSAGSVSQVDIKLKPGADFLKTLLDKAGVPPALKSMVDALVPGSVVHEVAIVTNYANASADASKKSKPDVRLKFTMQKDTWKKDFDITVKEADLNSSDDVPKKAGPQIFDQLTGEAVSGALAALGLKFDWTIIDVDLKVLAMKIDASGDPKTSYTLSGNFTLPVIGKFVMDGAWYPSKPLDPIVFESNNPFKPFIDETIKQAGLSDKMVLENKMYVTFGLTEEVVNALKSGGSGGTGGSTGGGKSSGGTSSFSLDVMFPMELQIDPTKGLFKMKGRVYPLQKTATLELAEGVVWENPFGFIPAKFNKLVFGTDPSFSSLTINGEGTTNFLDDMAFTIDILMRQGQDPTLDAKIVPTAGFVTSLLKKVNLPEELTTFTGNITLRKFDLNANFKDVVVSGKLPSADISLYVDHPVYGTLPIDIHVPSISLQKPDEFVAVVAKELIKNLKTLVTNVPGATIKNLSNKASDLAKDPIGTTKDLANKGYDAAAALANASKKFFDDPAANTKKLLAGALTTAKDIGEGAFNSVKDKLGKLASDPVGATVETAKEALKLAEQALGAAVDLFNAAAEALEAAWDEFCSWFGGDVDTAAEKREEAARAAKEQAEQEAAYARAVLREAEALDGYKAKIYPTSTADDLKKLKEDILKDPACVITIPFMTISIVRPKTQDFLKNLEGGIAELAMKDHRDMMRYRKNDATSVLSFNDLKEKIDKDARLSADQKSTLKGEIDEILNPQPVSADDAKKWLVAFIPGSNLAELRALKGFLDGTKVDRYFRFPNIENLTGASRQAFKTTIDYEITKQTVAFSDLQYRAALEYVANAKSAYELENYKALFTDPVTTLDELVNKKVEYLTADAKEKLVQSIDMRLKTVKVEGAAATMKIVRDFVAAQLNDYKNPKPIDKPRETEWEGPFGTPGADRPGMPKPEPRMPSEEQKISRLRESLTVIRNFVDHAETPHNMIGEFFVTWGQRHDLTEDQIRTLTDEIDAILNPLTGGEFVFGGGQVDVGGLYAAMKAFTDSAAKAAEADSKNIVAEVGKVVASLTDAAKTIRDYFAIRDALAGTPWPGYSDLSGARGGDAETKFNTKYTEYRKAQMDNMVQNLTDGFRDNAPENVQDYYANGKIMLEKVWKFDLSYFTTAERDKLRTEVDKLLQPFKQMAAIQVYMKGPKVTEADLNNLSSLLDGTTNTGLPSDLGSIANLTTGQIKTLKTALEKVMKPYTSIKNIRYYLTRNNLFQAHQLKDALDGTQNWDFGGNVDVASMTMFQKAQMQGEVADKIAALEKELAELEAGMKTSVAAAATLEELDAWFSYVCTSRPLNADASSWQPPPKPTATAPDLANFTDVQKANICAEIIPRQKAAKAFVSDLTAKTTTAGVREVLPTIEKNTVLGAEIKATLRSKAILQIVNFISADINNVMTGAASKAMQSTLNALTDIPESDKTKLIAANDERLKALKKSAASGFESRIASAASESALNTVQSDINTSDLLTEQERTDLTRAVSIRNVTSKANASLEAIKNVREWIEKIRIYAPELSTAVNSTAYMLNTYIDKNEIDAARGFPDGSRLSTSDKDMLKKEIQAAVDESKAGHDKTLEKSKTIAKNAKTRAELNWWLDKVSTSQTVGEMQFNLLTYAENESLRKDIQSEKDGRFGSAGSDPNWSDIEFQVDNAVSSVDCTRLKDTIKNGYLWPTAAARDAMLKKIDDKIDSLDAKGAAKLVSYYSALLKSATTSAAATQLKADFQLRASATSDGKRRVTEADEKTLVAEADTRIKELKAAEAAAWNSIVAKQRKPLSDALYGYTTTDEINLFIGHLEGKTVSTLGSFSLFSQDDISAMKDDARKRLAELPGLQSAAMTNFRDYIGRIDSEKGFDDFTGFTDNYKTFDRTSQPKWVQDIDVKILTADQRATLKTEAATAKGGLKKKQDDAMAAYRVYIAGLTKWRLGTGETPSSMDYFLTADQRATLTSEYNARISSLAADDYRKVTKTADRDYLVSIKSELEKKSVDLSIKNAVPGCDKLSDADRQTLIKETADLISTRELETVRAAITGADSSAVLKTLKDHVSGTKSQTVSKQYPDVSTLTADQKTLIATEIDARIVLVTAAEKEKAATALFNDLMSKVATMDLATLTQTKNDLNGVARAAGAGVAPDYSALSAERKATLISSISSRTTTLQAASTPPGQPVVDVGSVADFKNRINSAKNVLELGQIQTHLNSGGVGTDPSLGLPTTSKLQASDKGLLQLEIQKKSAALQSGGTSAPTATAGTTTATSFTPSASNVANGKAATGSTACATTEGPEKAFNGSAIGKWCSGAAVKYLQVDLGSVREITGYVVAHAGAGSESASFNTKDFTIKVSNDLLLPWSTDVTVTGNTSNVTKHTTTRSARYVRLEITAPTQTTDNAARIYEFEVNGK